ncbi:MAG: SapC family protein [Sphingomonas sp.]|uniref:SapC family protein n=1 Tax=Sphingomonas sp. TaxID=28214 RepID=UPI001AC06C3A|nr:SapC family protein [Sphingomonas sp.]MBN8808717.1 SapC family protein [Sphingomonas sp.]
MASAPQTLPLFYNTLEPLSSDAHAGFRVRPADGAAFLVNQHAIPLTVDEFPMAQRHFPIVFSQGDDAVPLALMGMNEGMNVFIDEKGMLRDPYTYVPAYVRRYPYMLARLTPDAQELTLCFDPTSPTIGDFADGEALFADGQPTDLTKNILEFSQQFEEAGARTAQFMAELNELGLLEDGEITIQPDGADKPFLYSGFRMVSEEKLRELRGDQLRKIVQSGMLPLIYAHLFSLSLTREIFSRQVQLGLMPAPQLTA